MFTPEFIFSAAFIGIMIALIIVSIIMIISVIVNIHISQVFDTMYVWILSAAVIMLAVQIYFIINDSPVVLSQLLRLIL
jgi:hypothetical protein